MAAISKPDVEEIARGLRLLIGQDQGSCHELRALNVHNGYRTATYAGFYINNIPAMAKEAARLDEFGGSGVYCTLNPVFPELAARAENRTVVAGQGFLTSDTHILRLRKLFIDVDAKNPHNVSGVAATDEEHAAAIDGVWRVREFLMTEKNWPAPACIDSGNGGYLWFDIDLERTDENIALLGCVLTSLAHIFNDEKIEIDTKVFNPARIARIPGTVNRKGDNIPARPHRRSQILESPREFEIVTREQLEQIARSAPINSGAKNRSISRPATPIGADSLRECLVSHNCQVTSEGPYQDVYKFVLARCPFDETHRDAAVFIDGNGKRGFHCFHNSCADKHWGDLNRRFEPQAAPVNPTPLDNHDSAGGDEGKANGSWPDPKPLGGELPPVEPFDVEMLPEALRPLVVDVAERMQIPIDLPAIAAVSSVAACVGRRATIQPKNLDPSWLVTPNLWAMLVTPPGFMKSPTISAITQPLNDIEALWRQEYNSELSEYGFEKEEADLRHNAWRDLYKAAQKNGHTPPTRPDNSVAQPVLRRLITHDATFEKLHDVLAHNPAGLFMVRDELSGFLATLDKEGREGERAFFLTAWNGDSSYTMDRVGRGTIHVPHCCISILSAITPGRLRSYLADTLQDGPTNDGLMQRFQLSVCPDLPKDWTYVNRPPDAHAVGMAQKMFRRLIALSEERPLACCYDPDAQSLFVDWYSELHQKLRNPNIHPVLVSHLAKYRKLQPALALLFELADEGSKPTVSLNHARQAAAWCDFLESHARRIYSLIVSPERQAAAELGRHLQEGWKCQEGEFTVREVYLNGWSGLDKADKVRPALEVLCDAEWTREAQRGHTVGRKTEAYLINPRLYRRQS